MSFFKKFNNTGLFIVFFIFLMASVSMVAAHQPRLEMGANNSFQDPIIIENPEISQAFYGELNGQPDFYKITSNTPFKFYISLLVPASPGISAELISAQLLDSSGNVILTVDGTNSTWEPYFEEFAGDYYLKGPEARANLTAGTYYLKIYNTNNQGKYSIAVGEIESFPIDESLKALVAIPIIKEQFFSKQVSTLFFQFMGIILALGTIMVLFVMLLKSRKSEELTKLTSNVSSLLKPVMWIGIAITVIIWLYVMFKNPYNIEGIMNTILLVIIIVLSWNMSSKLSKLEYGKLPLIKSTIWIILWWIFTFLAVVVI